MSGIATAVTVLVSSAFVAALIKIIAPTGKTEKIIKLVISLFILICIAVAFKTMFDSVKVSIEKYKNSERYDKSIQQAVDTEVLKVTGDYIAEYLNKLVSSEGVDAELIEVCLDTDENSVIKISDVNIYIEQDDLDYKNQITEIVEEYLDITPRVIVRE